LRIFMAGRLPRSLLAGCSEWSKNRRLN